MNSSSIIIAIIAILIISVIAITFIQRREEERAATRQKISQYKYRANQATTILSNLSSFPIGQETRQILLQYTISNLKAVQKLAPNDPINNKNIESLNGHLQNSSSPSDSKRLIIPNDYEQLTQQINSLSNLAKFLIKLSKLEAINNSLVSSAVNRISALISESKICAYLQQGQSALSRHEYIHAQQSFSMAQQMMNKISNKNERLIRLEKDLQEMIKSTPSQAMKKNVSYESSEVMEESEDELFGPKKKW